MGEIGRTWQGSLQVQVLLHLLDEVFKATLVGHLFGGLSLVHRERIHIVFFSILVVDSLVVDLAGLTHL